MSSTLVELTRSNHENIERYQKAIVEELDLVPKTWRENVGQTHRVDQYLEGIIKSSDQLAELYEDKDGSRAEETASITGSGPSVYSIFYEKLRDLKDYHRRFPHLEAELPEDHIYVGDEGTFPCPLTKVVPQFTGEECWGQCLDLHQLHERYLNLKGSPLIDYRAYLDSFFIFANDKEDRDEDYRSYLSALYDYLTDFLRRSQPLSELDELLKDFDRQFIAVTSAGTFQWESRHPPGYQLPNPPSHPNPKTRDRERDRERERERDRDKDRSRDRDRDRRDRSRDRDRRDRSRDRDGDRRDRERDKDRDRSRDRDRDRDRDRRDRSRDRDRDKDRDRDRDGGRDRDRDGGRDGGRDRKDRDREDRDRESRRRDKERDRERSKDREEKDRSKEPKKDKEREKEREAMEEESVWCEACARMFAKRSVFDSHLTGKKHQRALRRQQEGAVKSVNGADTSDSVWQETLRLEFIVHQMGTQTLPEIIRSTKNFLDKKQSKTWEEMKREWELEEREAQRPVEDSDSETEETEVKLSKDNYPVGWDGKPIPFWLYKLHGLGVEYKCEICGNASYWGRKAFEQHFQEWRHAHGMRSLGIPNTKHFHNITLIKDALQLYEKLKYDNYQSEFKPDVEEEFEDSEGNVFNKKTYEDLRRQGLINS